MSKLSKETVGPQSGVVVPVRVALLGLGLSAFVTLSPENLGDFSDSSSDPSVTNNGS